MRRKKRKKTRKEKKAESFATGTNKPKRSRYALKVKAWEKYLAAGGTWQGWIACRSRYA